MKHSDPDATLYYLARMIEAGEDPKYIARRIIVCASEDIGLADSQALDIHSYPHHFVEQECLPQELADRRFFRLTGNGYEQKIAAYFEKIDYQKYKSGSE